MNLLNKFIIALANIPIFIGINKYLTPVYILFINFIIIYKSDK
ncbi:hypothetical protein EZS27_004932 [termite gut metagenome]|uniref:Uncharacterized protein n=1 Tax=termite gut metagenome TaxID=433724 RepID=A0A5J4SP69_9ZZZZ